MTETSFPFAIAAPIPAKLDAVLSYWQDLRRGQAEIPFWDDLSLPAAQALCSQVFLIDVFATPERFRLSSAPAGLAKDEIDKVLGRFIDDVDLPTPFEFLRAQCSATVEAMRPTVYACAGSEGYHRLLLPAWGEGQVRMLLGAIGRD